MNTIMPDCISAEARATFRQFCGNCTKSKCSQFVSPFPFLTLRQMLAAFLVSKIAWEALPKELGYCCGLIDCKNFQESRRRNAEDLKQERASLLRRKLEERQLRLF